MAKSTNTELSSAEVQRRVAIIKRFRELLSQQRDRFRQYLTVLGKQKDVIEKGSADELMVHVELEEQIVGDILAIQKVIDPLEAMYQSAFPAGSAAVGTAGTGNSGGVNRVIGETALQGASLHEAKELPSLRAALEELRSEAVIRSGQNRDLLSRRMEEIRQEMKALRANPYAIHHSVYSDEGPALIDIAG